MNSNVYHRLVFYHVTSSLVPRPLFFVCVGDGEKKGLVDLRRTFCSTGSQILGVT